MQCITGVQVLTTWQCAVYLVWAFPYLSEMSAAMNALAELEGDPSVSQVAAQALADPLLAASVQPTGGFALPLCASVCTKSNSAQVMIAVSICHLCLSCVVR